MLALLVLGCSLVGLVHSQCIEPTYEVYTESILIHSAGFPNDEYTSDTDSCWRFQNANGYDRRLKITFRNFDTEQGFDQVDVYDGSGSVAPRIGSLSGMLSLSRNNTMFTTGPNMYVHFTTDISQTKRGWQACVCDTQIPCICEWLSVTDWTERMDGYESVDTGISLTLWIGIGAGVALLIFIPAIIWLSIACCACCVASRRNRHHTTINTTVTMATIDTSNVPAGMYPTQQNFTVAAPMSGMYPVQQGVAYAQPQAVVVPNAQASSGGEAPYPQVIAQGFYPTVKSDAGTEAVNISVVQPPAYTTPTPAPEYKA